MNPRGLPAGGTVVVTGAASGIGRATTLRLNTAGVVVVAVDVDVDGLDATHAAALDTDAAIIPVVADVTEPADVEKVMRSAGTSAGDGLRGIVNVVGGAKLRDVADMDLEWWHEQITFNLTSAFMMCRAALPHLRAGGSIVNLSSGWGFRAAPGRAAYAASKAGIVAFSRALAAEMANDGVRVNVVAPGPIVTERMLALSDGDTLATEAQTAVPLRRLGQPEEVAAVIVFLLSDDASYMTGQTVHVNGGVFMP